MTIRKTPRARDLGLEFEGEPGPFNAITDVAGVKVGYSTLVADSPTQVRTGVTAILPNLHAQELRPVWAGFHALNGNGEMTGTHWINEAGYLRGPICITNTHSVGLVHHAVIGWLIDRYAKTFAEEHMWAMPVVAETYDGVLNDINGRHVKEEHVRAALDEAKSGMIAEGNVGGGTGMITYEFKGGTGTASRKLHGFNCEPAVTSPDTNRSGYVAALVQANNGLRDWLTVLGAPIGRHLRDDLLFPRETGSIIVILATDLALSPSQLKRLAKRAALGIGRLGTPGGNNSGDIFLAFSTANSLSHVQMAQSHQQLQFLNDDFLDPVYEATVQVVEEAILNAMVAADDTPTFKPPGKIVRAIPHGQLVEQLAAYTRFSRR
jgi:D-aminopeptidase